MSKEQTPVKDFMRKKSIDLDTRVYCPNGGIYLRNLLQEFLNEVRDDVLVEVVKSIREKVSWVETKK
jgi:hypothetical protein